MPEKFNDIAAVSPPTAPTDPDAPDMVKVVDVADPDGNEVSFVQEPDN